LTQPVRVTSWSRYSPGFNKICLVVVSIVVILGCLILVKRRFFVRNIYIEV
jgi:hypothetical protein